MPRGDGTGPSGIGPMTGRSAGFCAGFHTPGFMRLMPGRGTGFGPGRGYGRLFWLGAILPGCVYLACRWAKRNR